MTKATLRRVEVELKDAEQRLAVAGGETNRLRRALDALPVGVVLADETGRLQVRNAAAREFHGHTEVLVEEAVAHQLTGAVEGQPGQQTIDFFGPPRRVLVEGDRRPARALANRARWRRDLRSRHRGLDHRRSRWASRAPSRL